MDLTSAASLQNETISVKLDDAIVHLFFRVFCEKLTPAFLRLIFLNSNFSEQLIFFSNLIKSYVSVNISLQLIFNSR